MQRSIYHIPECKERDRGSVRVFACTIKLKAKGYRHGARHTTMRTADEFDVASASCTIWPSICWVHDHGTFKFDQ